MLMKVERGCSNVGRIDFKQMSEEQLRHELSQLRTRRTRTTKKGATKSRERKETKRKSKLTPEERRKERGIETVEL